MPIKLLWKDTEKTSNHRYLFWGTEVGGNSGCKYRSGRETFSSIVFYAN